MTRTALVVDDNELVRNLAHDILARHGYEVSVAEDCDKGIAAMGNAEFDFYLFDNDVPEPNDGIRLARAVAKRYESQLLQDQTRGPYVWLMSGRANVFDEDYQRQLRELGVTEFIAKPQEVFPKLNTVGDLRY